MILTDRCAPPRDLRVVAALVLLAPLLAACGATHRRLAAAEPAHDGSLAARPAGRSVPVGNDPQGIVVEPGEGLVAVGVRNPSALVVLNARTGSVVRRISIAGAPRHLALAGARGPVLVPEESVNRLLEVQLGDGASRSYAVGTFPHDAAAVDGRVFVGNERGRSLSEILSDGRVLRIGGFLQPGGLVAIGEDLAVVDVGAFTLTLLDARTDRVLGRLPAGRGPTHAAADGDRVFVVDTRGDAIFTYTAQPFRLIGRTPLAGTPYGVAIDPARNHLWVTETATNRLAELTLAGRLPHLLRTYPTGLQPDTVAVDTDTGRVFVADQIAGTVEIIDPAVATGSNSTARGPRPKK